MKLLEVCYLILCQEHLGGENLTGVTQVPRNLMELLDFKDFIPEFSYAIDNMPESEKAQEQKFKFEAFLQENQELIISQMINSGVSLVNKDSYLRGFKDAIAITELWLSSLNLTKDISK